MEKQPAVPVRIRSRRNSQCTLNRVERDLVESGDRVRYLFAYVRLKVGH